MINGVFWHSRDSNFAENTQDIYRCEMSLKFTNLRVYSKPRGQWVKLAHALPELYHVIGVPLLHDTRWSHSTEHALPRLIQEQRMLACH